MKALLTTVALFLCFSLSVCASAPYYSYTYSYRSDGSIIDTAAPLPYLPEQVLTAPDLGAPLKTPEDLVLSPDGQQFYIADSGAHAVFCFDTRFHLLRTFDRYVEEGEEKTFYQPTGLCVDTLGNLYIADTGNSRVVVLDKDGGFRFAIEQPDSPLLKEGFQFQPLKVVVDEAGRVFVLCKNVLEGLMQFSPDGNFVGFVGSNKVVFDFVDLIWKTVMTEAQQEGLVSFVPVEYTNISLDEDGFIFAVTSVKNVDAPIRRLNPSGDDILIRNPLDGSKKVIGDVLYPTAGGADDSIGPSSFVDITQDTSGNYYALDAKRGRIFAYDEEGNMLFVFGGINTGQDGTFSNPTAIVHREGKLYVLDKNTAEITAFASTEYTQTIHRAIESYLKKDYAGSIQLWERVLVMNGNYDLAYMKAGYAYYRMEQYEKAMEMFKIANARQEYSNAYILYRKEWMNLHFGEVVAVLSGLVVLLVGGGVWLRVRRRRKRQNGRG